MSGDSYVRIIRLEARVKELELFIKNGVETGYISIPEKGDHARTIIERLSTKHNQPA